MRRSPAGPSRLPKTPRTLKTGRPYPEGHSPIWSSTPSSAWNTRCKARLVPLLHSPVSTKTRSYVASGIATNTSTLRPKAYLRRSNVHKSERSKLEKLREDRNESDYAPGVCVGNLGDLHGLPVFAN